MLVVSWSVFCKLARIAGRSCGAVLLLSKIRLWTVEILAVHTSSLCACTHIVSVDINNELQSYFRFVINVTKPVSYTHLTLPTILLV